MAITSLGAVTATSFNAVPLTAAGSAANFLTEAGTYVSIGSLGGGDVNKVGTPVNNEIGVWTGDGTIEGDTNLQWDGSTLQVLGSQTVSGTLDVTGVITSGNAPLIDVSYTWRQIKNELNISGIGLLSITSLSSTRIAFIDDTNNNLRAYDFDGTDWTQAGNELNISGVTRPSITALSSSRIAFIDQTNDDLRANDREL